MGPSLHFCVSYINQPFVSRGFLTSVCHNDSLSSFWCLYCYLWTVFTHCSGDSIVEQVNADWVSSLQNFPETQENHIYFRYENSHLHVFNTPSKIFSSEFCEILHLSYQPNRFFTQEVKTKYSTAMMKNKYIV